MCVEVFESCAEEFSQSLGMSAFLHGSPLHLLKVTFTYTICNLLPVSHCLNKNISCGIPIEIDNGRHDYIWNSIDIKSVAHYTCNDGHYVEGNSSTYCQYSGKWSQPPQCLLKQTYRTIIILSSVLS